MYVIATPGTFPTTGVLDDFNRANDPIGGWQDDVGKLLKNALKKEYAGR